MLKDSPFNVVLQSSPDPDDGSLSRLAARRGFRYLNVECSVADYEAQQERLRWIDDRFRSEQGNCRGGYFVVRKSSGTR